VFVCHSGNVICINQNAVAAHLGHGDILGPCNATSCPQSYAGSVDTDPSITEDGDIVITTDTDEAATATVENSQLQAFNYPNPFYPTHKYDSSCRWKVMYH
jgi:hypothetical protein